jgi:hypothetical protein
MAHGVCSGSEKVTAVNLERVMHRTTGDIDTMTVDTMTVAEPAAVAAQLSVSC